MNTKKILLADLTNSTNLKELAIIGKSAFEQMNSTIKKLAPHELVTQLEKKGQPEVLREALKKELTLIIDRRETEQEQLRTLLKK